MKFGLRTPSLSSRLSARTSPKRILAHNLGVKMPKGYGYMRNPKKFAYNKVYNKSSVSVDSLLNTGSKNYNPKLKESINFNNQGLPITRIRLPERSRKKALVLSIFLGLVGAHRFYLYKPWSAFLMLILTLSVYGLFITVPWLLLDLIFILDKSALAKYNHNRLLGKYDSILNNGFLDEYCKFKEEYPTYASQKEPDIILPLLKLTIDGKSTEKIQSVKKRLNSTNKKINMEFNKAIKLNNLFLQPLQDILSPLDIQKSENCYFSSTCSWNEIRKDRTYGEYWKEIHVGKVVITNKRIVFQTEDKKTKSIQLKESPKVSLIEDSIYIEKEKGKSPVLSNLEGQLFYIQYSKVVKSFFS